MTASPYRSSMTEKHDKRQSPRAPVSIRIDYSTVDQFFWDFAGNINEGGVFVESSRPLDVGSTVQLKFFLPNLEAPVETTGEVIWTDQTGSGQDPTSTGKPGMGIQFKELDEKSKAAINHLIKELKKK